MNRQFGTPDPFADLGHRWASPQRLRTVDIEWPLPTQATRFRIGVLPDGSELVEIVGSIYEALDEHHELLPSGLYGPPCTG